MVARARSRDEYTSIANVSSSQSVDDGVNWSVPVDYLLTKHEFQDTVDTVHHSWPRRKGKWNVGGDFTSTRRWCVSDYGPETRVERLDWPALHGAYRISGPRVPSAQFTIASSYPSYPSAPTVNDLNGWGTSGVNRTIPTSPLWNAAQFVGELHEGLPKIPLSGLSGRSTQDLGSEYLNYDFGIRPFISDADDALSAWKKADSRLSWLRANSGKKLRRRTELLNESTTTVTEGTGTLYPIFPQTWPGAPAKNSTPLITTTTSSRRVWFSGCYSYYYRPAPNSFRRGTQKARLIYGIDPSVSTVWELLPYSWLADWHANVGEVMENLSRFANDGLTMRWGYVMCHQLVKREISWRGGSVTFYSERKTRRAGNPYGFASNIASYTSRQWATLVALGIAKGPDVRF